ncbi:hypothetical protein Hanom_Chr16g01462461 [Helianthus anomalus]
MLKKVLEDLIGKPIEQRFEEIELAEVRAIREAEMQAGMKDKGKDVQVEDVVQVTEKAIVLTEPCPLNSVPGKDDEDDDDNMKDDADEVYSIHSDDDDDGNDDADQGTLGIKVTEASQEENIDEYLQDDANEEPENAGGEGEHGDSENVDETVDKGAGLILRLEHDVEEELNEFDINHQAAYQYKYVEEADNYDKVEVEDWSDDDQFENVNVDTSSFPTLAELSSQVNEDELRRKVAESVKNKSFQEMSKEEQREERKKWFRKDTERKIQKTTTVL